MLKTNILLASHFTQQTLIAVLLFFFALPCQSQNVIRNYIQQKSIPIATISPDSINFGDLEPIGNAIGDAQIVMLGEQDHGDAPTFLAKTRLIEYLHEKKGFNVLAFESDFFGLNFGWDKISKTAPSIDTFIKKNIYPIWTYCDACSSLFYKYVPGTWASSRPLVISGFDDQQFLSFSRNNLSRDLDSVFTAQALPITKQANYRPDVLPLIDSMKIWGLKYPADTVKISRCLIYLQQADTQLRAKVDRNSFWVPVVENLVCMAQIIKKNVATGKPDYRLRDIQMAKNLQWLADNKFKGQKIIVWAADAHIINALNNMKESFFYDSPAMGDYFVNRLKAKQKVYMMGFTSATGQAGRLGFKKHDVYPPRRNSLENWINPDFEYAFIDFDAFNRLDPGCEEYFFTKAQGHINYEGKWYNMYDGIFFVRHMYPCGGSDLVLHQGVK